MKTKITILAFLVLCYSTVVAQTPKSKDTTVKKEVVVKKDSTSREKVPVMWITDSLTFSTTTGWATKVVTYDYQYQQQPSSTSDSFTVKKVKVPKKQEYYIEKGGKEVPVNILFEFKNPYKQ